MTVFGYFSFWWMKFLAFWFLDCSRNPFNECLRIIFLLIASITLFLNDCALHENMYIMLICVCLIYEAWNIFGLLNFFFMKSCASCILECFFNLSRGGLHITLLGFLSRVWFVYWIFVIKNCSWCILDCTHNPLCEGLCIIYPELEPNRFF